MFRTYAWLTRLLLLPLLAWLWWRGPAYRRGWAQRLGCGAVSPSHVGALWVHAASVGKVQAAQALIALILEQAPDHAVVVSTQTPTGAQALRERWGDRVLHVYAPLDTRGAALVDRRQGRDLGGGLRPLRRAPRSSLESPELGPLRRSLRKEQARVAGLNWAEADWADLMRGYGAV